MSNVKKNYLSHFGKERYEIPLLTQKFDLKESRDASNIESILINSKFVDVNISTSTSDKIIVHFLGRIDASEKIHFDVRVVDKELKIEEKSKVDDYESTLKINLILPYKTFKSIMVMSLSGNIKLGRTVSTNYLKLETQTGKVVTNAMFLNASITTITGDIDLNTEARKNIIVHISSMSGKVSTKFKNVGKIHPYVNSMMGHFNNYHTNEKGYLADIEIATRNGDIEID